MDFYDGDEDGGGGDRMSSAVASAFSCSQRVPLLPSFAFYLRSALKEKFAREESPSKNST